MWFSSFPSAFVLRRFSVLSSPHFLSEFSSLFTAEGVGSHAELSADREPPMKRCPAKPNLSFPSSKARGLNTPRNGKKWPEGVENGIPTARCPQALTVSVVTQANGNLEGGKGRVYRRSRPVRQRSTVGASRCNGPRPTPTVGLRLSLCESKPKIVLCPIKCVFYSKSQVTFRAIDQSDESPPNQRLHFRCYFSFFLSSFLSPSFSFFFGF